MKNYGTFLLLLVCFLFAPVAQAQGLDWVFTLDQSDVQANPGERALFTGVITNNTGADLLLSRADLSFFATSPASTYHYDFTDEFQNINGVIPASGYAGSIFYVDWTPDAPLGTSGFGTVTLDADSTINPPTYALDFTAGIPSPVPEPSLMLSFALIGAGGTGFLLRRRK